MNRIAAPALLVLLLSSCSEFLILQCGTEYRWTVVGTQGVVRTIYVDPAALSDMQFLADLVSHLTQDRTTSQLMFFDDRKATPSALPMSDAAMLHLRAQYNYNPNTGFEQFVFLEVSDKNTSPPTMRETPAAITRR
jgi:hypothetical protein